MPVYEYRCEACAERFEEYLRASTAPAPPCPACGSEQVERLFSGFGTKWRPSFINWHRVGSSWGKKPPKKVF
jgi:putative FmdB family regulatory protein